MYSATQFQSDNHSQSLDSKCSNNTFILEEYQQLNKKFENFFKTNDCLQCIMGLIQSISSKSKDKIIQQLQREQEQGQSQNIIERIMNQIQVNDNNLLVDFHNEYNELNQKEKQQIHTLKDKLIYIDNFIVNISQVITTQDDNSFKPGSDEFTDDGLDYNNPIEQQSEYLGNQQLSNQTNLENESLSLLNSSKNKQHFENQSEINSDQNNKTSVQVQKIPKEQQKKSEQYTTSNYGQLQSNNKVKYNQVQNNNQQQTYKQVNQLNNNSNNDQFAYNYSQNNQMSIQSCLAKFSNTNSSNQSNSNSISTYQVSNITYFNNHQNQTNSSSNSNDLFDRSYNNLHQNACEGILDETLNNNNSYQQNIQMIVENSQIQEEQPICNPNINPQEKDNQQNYDAQQINQQINNQINQHIQLLQFQNNSGYGQQRNVCTNNTSTLYETNQQQQQQNIEMTDNNVHEEGNLSTQHQNNLPQEIDEKRKYKNIYQWVYRDLKQIIQELQNIPEVFTQLFTKHEKEYQDKKQRAKKNLFQLFKELKNNKILTQYISNFENEEDFLQGINIILQKKEVRKSKRKEIDFDSKEYKRQRILMFKAFQNKLQSKENK
ncbi:Ras family protein (macronuclear) [Tetrahymena thermophila SB210]|uniref:Ras family protein n=1 Tax=Tetrahymena thermophila (strain SB210) TaxID=312017 RepID=I7MB07_TETTS|nr:Ras family protein [Tetrahymena thermophila SB210]EAS07071.2 Ras family protein [Tetrahymena thermophila SB210]|eukprot:XP_001027313.2 Ras family protein [Tetrahymena thermophila SB210]